MQDAITQSDNLFHADSLTSLPPEGTMSLVDEQGDKELLSRIPKLHIVEQALLFYADNCCTMSESNSKASLLFLFLFVYSSFEICPFKSRPYSTTGEHLRVASPEHGLLYPLYS